MTESIYAETLGTTCYLNGERCTTTATRKRHGETVGVFAKSDERPVMYYVEFGGIDDDKPQWWFVKSVTQITRDQFDALVDVPLIRHSLGWRS